MKAYVKIAEAICTDPECCGGEDHVDGVTLSKKVADEWNKSGYTRVEEFELTEEAELPSTGVITEEGFMGKQKTYERDSR